VMVGRCLVAQSSARFTISCASLTILLACVGHDPLHRHFLKRMRAYDGQLSTLLDNFNPCKSASDSPQRVSPRVSP